MTSYCTICRDLGRCLRASSVAWNRTAQPFDPAFDPPPQSINNSKRPRCPVGTGLLAEMHLFPSRFFHSQTFRHFCVFFCFCPLHLCFCSSFVLLFPCGDITATCDVQNVSTFSSIVEKNLRRRIKFVELSGIAFKSY